MARLFITLVLVAFSHVVAGEERTCNTVSGLEGCACTDSETNEIVSLQGLVSNNTMIPRFKVEADTNWNFAYHPCGTFDMFLNVTDPNPGYYGCKGSTAARYESGAVKQCSGLGNLDGAMFKYDNNFTYPVVSNFTVTYRNKSSTAKQGAVISLICDRSLTMENSTLEYINSTEGVEETYYMSLRSPCACPGGCEAKVLPTTQPPATNGSTTAVPSNATTTAKPSSGYWTVANTNVISVMLLVGLFVVGVVYAE